MLLDGVRLLTALNQPITSLLGSHATNGMQAKPDDREEWYYKLLPWRTSTTLHTRCPYHNFLENGFCGHNVFVLQTIEIQIYIAWMLLSHWFVSNTLGTRLTVVIKHSPWIGLDWFIMWRSAMRATQSAWISLSHIEEATARYSCTHGYKSLYAPRAEVCLRVWCSRCSCRPLSLGFGYS